MNDIKHTPGPKLKVENIQIRILHKQTNDKWIVEFNEGVRGNITAKVFQNGNFVASYSPKGGLANKTKALFLVKHFIAKAEGKQ